MCLLTSLLIIELSALKTLASTLAEDVDDAIQEFATLKQRLGLRVSLESNAQIREIADNVKHTKDVVDERGKPPWFFTVW